MALQKDRKTINKAANDDIKSKTVDNNLKTNHKNMNHAKSAKINVRDMPGSQSDRIARHLPIIRVTRLIVDIVLLLNLLTLLGLPWLLTAIYRQPALFFQLETGGALYGPELTVMRDYPADLPPSSYLFYLVFLYVAGLCTAWLLLEGHLILRRLERLDPFSQKQSASFSRMTAALALLSADFLIKVFAYNTLLTMFSVFAFLMLALIAKILADVFYQAYLVKTDQELTI